MWFNNCEHNNTTIINYCKQNKPKNVFIDSDTEWLWRFNKNEVDAIYETGVEKIEFLFSSFPCDYYQDYYEPLGISSKNITHWPTFWFNWAEVLSRHEGSYKTQTYSNFQYPFISLNNKSHDHRCAIMDMLAKYQILDKGIVTWNKTPFTNDTYKFKHYDNSFRGLSDDFVNKLDSFLICKEQHESFIHVIGEATCSVPFITEKTVLPMLYKKPFVTLSHSNWNKYLRNLGFELFEEIIDYSYDSIDNLEDRADKMVQNLLPLVGQNYDKLYQKLLPKLEHNYNRVWEIIRDVKYIPEIIQERYHKIKKDNLPFEGFDGRYQIFMEQTIPN